MTHIKTDVDAITNIRQYSLLPFEYAYLEQHGMSKFLTRFDLPDDTYAWDFEQQPDSYIVMFISNKWQEESDDLVLSETQF